MHRSYMTGGICGGHITRASCLKIIRKRFAIYISSLITVFYLNFGHSAFKVAVSVSCIAG